MTGRRKTLDRNHALTVALTGYWSEGYYGMSLNEVCRRANISKPGLYREFGGDDGLLCAVLGLYRQTVLDGLSDLLLSDRPFEDTLRNYLELLLYQEDTPAGCLLAEFRLIQQNLGELTKAAVINFTKELQSIYRSWLEKAQQAGEVTSAIELDVATQHLDSQIMIASIKAQRGMDRDEIRRNTEMALWCLTPNLSL